MYAVIFTARIRQIDDEYFIVANRMRSLATEKYGCIEFESVSEGNREISISYWPGLENIESWKNDPEHMEAQKQGQQRWYSSYQIKIANIEREYERHI